MAFELQFSLEIPCCAQNLYLHSNSPLFNSITLGLVIAMETSLQAIRITLSPLILNVMQGSYNYQFLSHWFNPTLSRTPSLPFQKQTFHPIGHLDGNNLFWFTILPPSKQVHHRRIGKCVVDTLTFENAIRILLLE